MGKTQKPILRRDADGEMVIDNRERVAVVLDDLRALSAEVDLLRAIAEAARAIESTFPEHDVTAQEGCLRLALAAYDAPMNSTKGAKT